ncbi:Signal transduction histidine kinase (plasmid) [Cupriavidus taiwanensis]|uniref:Signal transduction histidine kinase n=1 Tax=Cupriavidus taiwanensis TaxID=164546 RepID=A0A375IB13_9BURK|nr:Signal transduction histidine kinase [Cupriavidus taiwanensis]SPK77063.1 Signal transduction histidine kinase [Cupriavidus taiwanensis]
MTGQSAPDGKFQPFDKLHPRAIDFAIGMGTVAVFMALAYLVQEKLQRYWEVSSLLAVWLGAGIGLMAGLFLVRGRRMRHRSTQNSESVEKNEARMSAIIRSSVEAIISVDSEQRVVLFNPMAEALFAWPAELAIGRPLGDFIPERFRAAHEEHVRRFGITGVSERQMGRQRALFAMRRDGSEFPIEASISQTVEGGAKLFTVMLRDVTERARADEALRTSLQRVKDSEARLAGIIRSSMEAIITVDSDQRVILFNPMAETLFGWPAVEAIGRPLADFIPERFRQAHEAHVRRFGVTGVSDRAMGRQRALYALRRDGTEFPIEASISQISDHGTRLYTVMLRDITDRVRAEDAMRRSREALQHLSDSILSTREEEKRRIARELHDDLGQRLSAMKMDLAMLGADLKEGKSMHSLLADVAAMNSVIDETVASVRRIASDLRPALLDELGMLAAIEWLAGDCAKRYGLSVSVDGSDIEVPEEVAIAMFRIVQEALSNVVRHANATAVHIRVAHDQGRLELQVLDNGVGWDKIVEDDEPRKSLGLLGIRERARLLGGTVDVDSAPGQGFCVAIRIPYTKKENLKAGPAA